jgi:hypothetical protein
MRSAFAARAAIVYKSARFLFGAFLIRIPGSSQYSCVVSKTRNKAYLGAILSGVEGFADSNLPLQEGNNIRKKLLKLILMKGHSY